MLHFIRNTCVCLKEYRPLCLLIVHFEFSEYARYLHANLDQTMEAFNLDNDFPEEFKDHWLKNLPFDIQVKSTVTVYLRR